MFYNFLLLLLDGLGPSAQVNKLVNENRVHLIRRIQNLLLHYGARLEGRVLVHSDSGAEGVSRVHSVRAQTICHGGVSCR